MKRLISSAIAKELVKCDSVPEPDAAQNAKDSVYLLSLVQSHAGSITVNVTQPTMAAPKPPAVTLQFILKRSATSGPKWKITAPSLEERRSPNYYIYHISSSSIDTSINPDEESQNELDLHANIIVIGVHAYILNYTGCTAEVSPFTSFYDSLNNVPIVDVIIA